MNDIINYALAGAELGICLGLAIVSFCSTLWLVAYSVSKIIELSTNRSE